MRVWVTGASGFIGRHLTTALGVSEDSVFGLGRQVEAGLPGLAGVYGGALNEASLQRLREVCGVPDVIYHLAGGSSVGASVADPAGERVKTVDAGQALLRWMRDQAPGASLVLASTAAVYGTGHSGPIPEGAPLAPLSPYGHCKLELEGHVREAGAEWGLKAVILRFFSLYGPGLHRQLLWDILSRLKKGEAPLRLSGTGQESRDFMHVQDAVRLLVWSRALASPMVPTLNGGTGTGRTVRSIALDLAERWEPRSAIEFNGEQRPGDPQSLVADVTNLQTLGFTPTKSWEAGLDELLRWFKGEHL
jgi:UDP-glucose 4-epimerase